MPKPIQLVLTAQERKELERIRDRHPKPYVRERAAALLKIAAGRSGRDVALHGLLKRRHPDTIYGWVRRYKAEGVKGLLVRPGRGRKPAFSPSAPERGGGPGGDASFGTSGAAGVGGGTEPLDPGSDIAGV